MLAAEGKCIESVSLLLEHGADVFQTSSVSFHKCIYIYCILLNMESLVG